MRFLLSMFPARRAGTAPPAGQPARWRMRIEPVEALVPPPVPDGRRAMVVTGALSATGLTLLGGPDARARRSGEPDADRPARARDLALLEQTLRIETDLLGAYRRAIASGVLDAAVLAAANAFLGHHEAHHGALCAAIGRPGDAASANEVGVGPAASRGAGLAGHAGTPAGQAELVAELIRLELAATNAYLGLIPAARSPELARLAAQLAADETMHFTALTAALGHPLPTAALSFGLRKPENPPRPPAPAASTPGAEP